MKWAEEEWKRDKVYGPKGHDDLMFALAYFMTSKVMVTLFMAEKGHRVIRGSRNLLYYPKGKSDLCGRFDLAYDPKRSQGL